MLTNRINDILASAYDRAAFEASVEICGHLRPFNLKRHPLSWDGCLTVGGKKFCDLDGSSILIRAVQEAGIFVEDLPQPVQARLRYWL